MIEEDPVGSRRCAEARGRRQSSPTISAQVQWRKKKFKIKSRGELWGGLKSRRAYNLPAVIGWLLEESGVRALCSSGWAAGGLGVLCGLRVGGLSGCGRWSSLHDRPETCKQGQSHSAPEPEPEEAHDVDNPPPPSGLTSALRPHLPPAPNPSPPPISAPDPPSRRHHVEADIGSLGLADWQAPGQRGQPGFLGDSPATCGSRAHNWCATYPPTTSSS